MDRLITNDDIIRAIMIFNSKHRRFKIEYESKINFFCVKDIKNRDYKVFITIPNSKDIKDLIDVFNDLIKDLS